MFTELSELERRAELHRALGDPGRLALVDALALGDASPSELQRALGMASNLLAHHVDVLAGAGIVRRVRSEGDRRRSYLTLVPGVLDDLAPSATVEAARVVFVCAENAARSQLAAALWTGHNPVPADSAGTRPADRIHPGALAAAARHRLPIADRRPRRLDEVLRPGDLVITVCDRAHEELPGDVAAAHWSIPDPARGGGDQAFDESFHQLTGRITRLAPAIQPTATEAC
ncbi:helix-turn-helix domain-containing protein [Pseudonocardia eucalypti]|uniref:Helix-turn-helix domain-containing protein n=1 Tax=Pseudonocardia eucalypti TaxID=648755 RepID=A0ABP9PMP9_9PSEU|nr:protein-tyrosine-phosphatase [Pseudonocardia eucalypti]